MTYKQAFIRLLKELGIYKVYIEDLKIGKRHHIDDYCDLFSYLINLSLVWRMTRHEKLYTHLNYSIHSSFTPSYLIYHDEEIKELKVIVDRYINDTNKPDNV